MEDCLFCKIAAGEIPSNKLYEDDTLLAFYDIDPQAPVHFLVIPKRHIASAAALTEDDAALLGHIYAVIAQLCRGCLVRLYVLQNHLQVSNSFYAQTDTALQHYPQVDKSESNAVLSYRSNLGDPFLSKLHEA